MFAEIASEEAIFDCRERTLKIVIVERTKLLYNFYVPTT